MIPRITPPLLRRASKDADGQRMLVKHYSLKTGNAQQLWHGAIYLRMKGGGGGRQHRSGCQCLRTRAGERAPRLSVTAPTTRAARAGAGAARRARGAERGQSGAGGRLARDLTVTGTLPLPRSAPRGRHCACAAPRRRRPSLPFPSPPQVMLLPAGTGPLPEETAAMGPVHAPPRP